MGIKGILLVLTRCTEPDRENEWRKWYDNVHIPHVIETETPGLVEAKRYENANAGLDEPRSLAIYDMDRHPSAVFKEMRARMNQRRAEGTTYTIDCMDIMLCETYRRIY